MDNICHHNLFIDTSREALESRWCDKERKSRRSKRKSLERRKVYAWKWGSCYVMYGRALLARTLALSLRRIFLGLGPHVRTSLSLAFEENNNQFTLLDLVG